MLKGERTCEARRGEEGGGDWVELASDAARPETSLSLCLTRIKEQTAIVRITSILIF